MSIRDLRRKLTKVVLVPAVFEVDPWHPQVCGKLLEPGKCADRLGRPGPFFGKGSKAMSTQRLWASGE